MKSTKYKHLTIEDKETIEDCLKDNYNLFEIANILKKHPTTISKEIRRRRISVKLKTYGRTKAYMENFNFVCPKTERYPHVCNACPSRRRCSLQKYYYRAREAHSDYLYDLSDSRTGYNTTVETVQMVSDLITPLIEKGHSFYHIKANNPDIPYSIQTLYKYTNDGLFGIKNIDLPKKVKYKERKKNNVAQIREAKKGLMYQDYNTFVSDNDIIHSVQVDTLEGKSGDRKVLLTIHFLPSRCMLIRLLPSQTAHEVVSVFNNLEEALDSESFIKLFEVVLTDNGSEFDDVLGLKFSSKTGEQRMNLFYCDAMSPEQKGSLEKNHTLIRCIFPKGTSTEILDKRKVKLIETNVNSYTRKVLNDKAPHDVFKYTYGAKIVKALNLDRIEPNEVILKPYLIK